jgi:translation initiation factor 3 subunit F
MDNIFIQSEADDTLSVKVHPVVFFSILDHFSRRPEGQDRVIGTLLGTRNAGVTEVLGCFPVPHLEKKDEETGEVSVAVGKDFNKQMLKLQKAVDRGAQVVGWYGTAVDGVQITSSSALIHEFYGNECPEPVHLTVDTSMVNASINIKAFISVPLTVAVRSLSNQFRQIPVELESMEQEAIALDAMIRGQGDDWTSDGGKGLSTLSTESENLHRSMKRLLDMLETTSDYVDKVVAGEEPANNELGRRIADTLTAVPQVRPEVFDRVFNNSLQDLLMVGYLSNLTRMQLAIAATLQHQK